MTNYLLIDLSYLLFYRFYAVSGWFKRAYPDIPTPDDFDWAENKIFMDKIEKTIMDNFALYIRHMKLTSVNIHLIKDCPRPDIWRSFIYPEYKKNRDELYAARPDFKGGKVFQKCYSDIIPKLIELWNCNYWSHPHLEADDIIAILSNHFSKDSSNKVYILSSDTDLLSILKPNTIFIDSKEKVWNEKSRSKTEPELNVKFKEILGDPGDNIPKWFAGIGEKTCETIINDPKRKLDFFRKDPDSFRRLALNRILVSFDFIPELYVRDIKAAITSL